MYELGEAIEVRECDHEVILCGDEVIEYLASDEPSAATDYPTR